MLGTMLGNVLEQCARFDHVLGGMLERALNIKFLKLCCDYNRSHDIIQLQLQLSNQ